MRKPALTYDLYPRIIDYVEKSMRKIVPKSMKASGPGDRVGRYFTQTNPEAAHSLQYPTMAEEHFWEVSGGPVVLPESKRFLMNLYRARFDLDTAQYLRFPFGSFMLGMPHKTNIEGFEVPPALVTWCQAKRLRQDVYDPFARYLGMTSGRSDPGLKSGEGTDGYILNIVFQHPDHLRARSKISVNASDIPNVLNAEGADSIIGIIGELQGTQPSSLLKSRSHELHLQAILLRLVVAMAVYHTATHGDGSLAVGIPHERTRFSISMPRFARPMSFRSISRSDAPQPKDEGFEISHYRSWHFRQLRHERYYRGVFSGCEVGSRIVFVSDATVTRKKRLYEDDVFMFDEADNQKTLNQGAQGFD